MPGFDLDDLKYRFAFFFLVFGFVLSFSLPAKAQNAENALLLDIISKLQTETPYRFLYRESLISQIRISLDPDDELFFNELHEQLEPHGVELRVDSSRYQVLLLQASDRPVHAGYVDISGHVVDAQTGERLPYATISWIENGLTKGIVAGKAGSFSITGKSTEPTLKIRVSYMGYEPEETTLNILKNPRLQGLTIRLTPKVITGANILVTGVSFYAAKDTSISGMVNAGRFSPLGNNNTVRALQVLPSASLTTAMNDGLNIRGSNPDGFQVILDGMNIFNQSHLFGLLDSFNADAIQTHHFFYDVTPARFQASTGGTLALLTRTGSQQRFKANSGVSNSSFKATAEGPLTLTKGRSSWLISGRNSYMNSLTWFNNPDLIKWGLDIDRPKSVLGEDLSDLNAEIVEPGNSEAHFFDFHGKVYHERRTGSRLMASVYYGGDKTHQTAFRQARTLSSEFSFEAQHVETTNDWSNFAGSIHYQHELTDRIYSHSMAGISAYETYYSKDDFVYTRFAEVDGDNQVSMFTYPFLSRSTINEFKTEQVFDVNFTGFAATLGAAYIYYIGDYLEDSFDREGFFRRLHSSQVDGFAQLDLLQSGPVHLEAGSRVHYFSEGNYLKWSPRIRLRMFPGSVVSLGAGFSRNYQFLHRVGFSNTVTSDVWILSDSDQPPSSVNHFSAGIYIQPFHHSYLQIEAYVKHYQNLRLHDINTQTFGNAFADTPWFYENTGSGKGIEMLLQNQVTRFLSLNQTYTISSMELQNPYLFDGEKYFADWDRRHRLSSVIEMEPVDDFWINLSWNYATGAPNKLADTEINAVERLQNYRRFDLSMLYAYWLSGHLIEMKLSVFNLFDHQNTWYREYNLAIDNSSSTPRLTTVPVDVYDLGFQPSFEIVISF